MVVRRSAVGDGRSNFERKTFSRVSQWPKLAGHSYYNIEVGYSGSGETKSHQVISFLVAPEAVLDFLSSSNHKPAVTAPVSRICAWHMPEHPLHHAIA